MSHLKLMRAEETKAARLAARRNPAPTHGARRAIILAGGDGTRLRALTRAISGDERPKQFCPILGDETLLDQTRARVARVVRSEETVFVVTRTHERYYRPLLAGVPRAQIVAQPENKGTAPAILYALLSVARAEPEAVVAFFPSDHHFADDESFAASVEAAFRAAESQDCPIVLLGIEPESAETGYGWIEPCESILAELPGAISRVRRFWEKPAPGVAAELFARGCLWNSFVMVGRADAFIEMIRRSLPELFQIFSSVCGSLGTAEEEETMRPVYDWLPSTNFSHEVLAERAEDLFVLRAGDAGWSDWGEPARVLSTLARLGVEAEWAVAAG